MFDPKSRYAKLTPQLVPDHRGRQVLVVPVPEAEPQVILGYHRRRQGERLDHLAQKYLDNPAGFWRIAETNDCMLAESLAEAPEPAIPPKER